MELILIRHALPVRMESADGSPVDPHLSEEGLAQAGDVAVDVPIALLGQLLMRLLVCLHLLL